MDTELLNEFRKVLDDFKEALLPRLEPEEGGTEFAAKLLGLSPRTVRNKVCLGELPVKRLPNGRLRFTRSELLAYLKERNAEKNMQ